MEKAIQDFLNKYKNIRPVKTEIQVRPNDVIKRGTVIMLMHPDDFKEFIKNTKK